MVIGLTGSRLLLAYKNNAMSNDHHFKTILVCAVNAQE